MKNIIKIMELNNIPPLYFPLNLKGKTYNSILKIIMKKLLIILLIFISSINYSYSEYNLSTKDTTKVDKAIIIINKYIDKKGERFRPLIINKINKILKRNNLSEKIIAIFIKLKEGINLVEDKKSTNKEKDDELKQYWIELLNKVRKDEHLTPYTYDNTLNYTAKLWSDLSLNKGTIDHKVDTNDSYYDYTKKANWMKEKGVICKNVNRVTFSESIAWGQFICNKDDCTKEIKDTMKKSFDFYMSEKGKKYKPHYEAIINPYFKTIGLGLSIKDIGNNKYTLYLTNHYCTQNEIVL